MLNGTITAQSPHPGRQVYAMKPKWKWLIVSLVVRRWGFAMLKSKLVTVALIAGVLGYLELPARAHEHSFHKFNESRRAALARAGHLTEVQAGECKDQPTCQLTIDLVDGRTKKSIAGLTRSSPVRRGTGVGTICSGQPAWPPRWRSRRRSTRPA